MTFESLDVGSSYSHIHYISREFVYEGHWVKVKATRAKKIQNPYSGDVKLRSAITLVLQNSHEVCMQHGF